MHHIPTKGGIDEQNRYKQQYIRTLSLYEEVFDEKPPTDIWPTVDKRFEAIEKFVRINLENKWLIPKPSLTLQKLMLVIIAPLFLVACTENIGDKDIWFWFKVALGVYVIYKILSWLSSGGGKNSGGGSGGGVGCGG